MLHTCKNPQSGQVEITSDGEYTTLTYTEREIVVKEVTFRNVGERNEDSSIQFEITSYTGKRTLRTSFFIPLALAETFLTNLKTAAL